MKKYFLLPIVLLMFLGSCETEEQTPNKPLIKEKISGFVQKGPFVSGTSILMNELKSDLAQTGKVFTSQISNNLGLFEITNIELSSSFVEFTTSGFYFNEVSGDISISPITLTSISDIENKNSINVNATSSPINIGGSERFSHQSGLTDSPGYRRFKGFSLVG